MVCKNLITLSLILVVCYVSLALSKSSYIDLVRDERELIRDAKRTCFSHFGVDWSTPIPANVLNTDPKMACSFYCTLLELDVVNENGFNAVLSENIPTDAAKSRDVIKKYHDLCYENPRMEPEAFMQAQRGFARSSPKILQQIASIYGTWAIISQN